jgi:hypothetical protein
MESSKLTYIRPNQKQVDKRLLKFIAQKWANNLGEILFIMFVNKEVRFVALELAEVLVFLQLCEPMPFVHYQFWERLRCEYLLHFGKVVDYHDLAGRNVLDKVRLPSL